LLLSKYGIWRWGVCIIDKYFVGDLLILMMDLIVFRSHDCFVLKMWIVCIFMLEKVCHLFKIVWWEKIFQFRGLVLSLLEFLLLGVFRVAEKLILNIVIKRIFLVHLPYKNLYCIDNLLFGFIFYFTLVKSKKSFNNKKQMNNAY